MSNERKVTVRYYDGSIPKFKGYEELEVSGEKLTVYFETTEKGTFAKEVPLRFALRLHRSEAFDIVGEDGKVPVEFQANASPHGRPKSALPAAHPVGDVRALQAENADLKSQVKELTASLEEAAKDFDELEQKYLALQSAQVPVPTAAAPAAKSAAASLKK